MKQFKRACSIFIAMVLMFGLSSTALAAEKPWADNFRVVGYYSGDLFNEAPAKMQFDKLTHIMYAFLIPKEDGSFEPLEKPEQLKELVRLGHEKGTEIFIAIGR